jgi:hypothetical protein
MRAFSYQNLNLLAPVIEDVVLCLHLFVARGTTVPRIAYVQGNVHLCLMCDKNHFWQKNCSNCIEYIYFAVAP